MTNDSLTDPNNKDKCNFFCIQDQLKDWGYEIDFSGLDLSNLTFFDLEKELHVDLSNVNLSGINLRVANLAGAYLDMVYLNNTDLRNANLENVSFMLSDFNQALLIGAKSNIQEISSLITEQESWKNRIKNPSSNYTDRKNFVIM